MPSSCPAVTDQSGPATKQCCKRNAIENNCPIKKYFNCNTLSFAYLNDCDIKVPCNTVQCLQPTHRFPQRMPMLFDQWLREGIRNWNQIIKDYFWRTFHCFTKSYIMQQCINYFTNRVTFHYRQTCHQWRQSFQHHPQKDPCLLIL